MSAILWFYLCVCIVCTIINIAIFIRRRQDVTPEELERLKLCRHNCKIDCLLESYNKVVEERDNLRMKREAMDTEAEDAQEQLHAIWDYATVNEIGWMQTAASNTECTLHTMAGELFRLKQPKLLNKYDLAMAAMANDPVYIEMRDRGGKGPYDDRWALLSPNDWSLNSKEYRAVSTYLGDAVLIEDYYNKIWRCWDKKPTDEQKRRETWND